MGGLTLEAVSKRFRNGTEDVLKNLNVDIAEGELTVLLGPSGCGKTTTLNCVAGLDSPSSGRIVFGDGCVYDSTRKIDLRPDRRDIGMVFQNFALWPHMTVRRNISYPLVARGKKRHIKDGWVESMADLVHCSELLERLPAQLSGGQQQRVALARALVTRPSVMLFDEPLSSLDAKLRLELRGEIRQLHESEGFTGVYVTHDQSEALAVASRIAVMNGGRLEQYAEPATVYRCPATRWVAGFMGVTNMLSLKRDGGGPWRIGDTALDLGSVPELGDAKAVVLGFRPDALSLATPTSTKPDSSSHLRLPPGTVTKTVFSGDAQDYQIEVAGQAVVGRVASRWRGDKLISIRPGEQVQVMVSRSNLLAYDETGERIDIARGAHRDVQLSEA